MGVPGRRSLTAPRQRILAEATSLSEDQRREPATIADLQLAPHVSEGPDDKPGHPGDTENEMEGYAGTASGRKLSAGDLLRNQNSLRNTPGLHGGGTRDSQEHHLVSSMAFQPISCVRAT